jgi:DNA-binding CsgD family transcriptional regulator
MTSPAVVIGREEELDTIEAFLARLDDGPAALVLAGEPGIGKTILWEAGLRRARARGARVLACRGVEAEASFAFAALSELLAGAFDEAAPALAHPRRRALEVALLLAEPGELVPETLVIGLAVLDVLRVLAEAAPVVVAADDLHWLDASSAAVLNVALRRLRGERIGLLATLRAGPDATVPELPDARVERMPLAALSLGALHHLLRERLGLDLRRPALARVHEASGGNPFFALELGRELLRLDLPPRADRALRVPRSLHEMLGGRLARLPGPTLDVLVRAAALARPTVELIGGEEEVAAALADAAREGVVELHATQVRFAHPLLASICYERASPERRREVHAALAAVVTDVEERARHLALATTGPDEAVAGELEAAAEVAAARGATAGAAELAELAAERTACDRDAARRRRLRAAEFHHFAGDRARAEAILQRLLDDASPGLERADLLFALASIWRTDLPVQMELCNEALAEAGDDDRRCARILASRAWVHHLSADSGAGLSDARTALERAERVGEPELLATVIARLAQVEDWTTNVTPGLLERGAEIEERNGLVLDYRSSPSFYLSRHLTRLGRLDRARELLAGFEADAAARGDEGTRVNALWHEALLEWHAGRWPLALEHATRAHELSLEVWTQASSSWTGRVKALIEIDLGLVAEARRSAAEGLAFAEEGSNKTFVILIRGVLGRIELVLGNVPAAAEHLSELPAQLLAAGLNDPAQPVWPDAIETLVALGELDRASSYLEAFERNARQLASPYALEAAARCRGLLTAAAGDVRGGIDELERAVAAVPAPEWLLERARTLLALGSLRRQAQKKRPAREALEQAVRILDELGAPLWAEKARAELRRISGRQPAATDGLTETELRVAELAMQGRTNREIAAELFMGVSTVEMHLTRVYRKLGVRSRTALAASLVIARDAAAQP